MTKVLMSQYDSVAVASTLVGSYMNANYGYQMPVDVEVAYAGTVGSVVLLIRTK